MIRLATHLSIIRDGIEEAQRQNQEPKEPKES